MEHPEIADQMTAYTTMLAVRVSLCVDEWAVKEGRLLDTLYVMGFTDVEAAWTINADDSTREVN